MTDAERERLEQIRKRHVECHNVGASEGYCTGCFLLGLLDAELERGVRLGLEAVTHALHGNWWSIESIKHLDPTQIVKDAEAKE
jgi:hypothetical protein